MKSILSKPKINIFGLKAFPDGVPREIILLHKHSLWIKGNFFDSKAFLLSQKVLFRSINMAWKPWRIILFQKGFSIRALFSLLSSAFFRASIARIELLHDNYTLTGTAAVVNRISNCNRATCTTPNKLPNITLNFAVTLGEASAHCHAFTIVPLQ